MATILDKIVEAKRRELEQRMAQMPLSVLEDRIAKQPPPLNFAGALMGDKVRLIAEVKKASPSKGVFVQNFDPLSVAKTYAQNGAAAISVLTDSHFQGRLEHLESVSQTVHPLSVPVLRKDFLFHPYQVYESRAYGADAFLLIVSILTPQELKQLLQLATRFWLQCLVEVHTKQELKVALDAGAEIIGINNRDLKTFHTDVAVTQQLARLVPPGRTIVSESGISTREDIQKLRRFRVDAVLVGEALVTADNVAAKVRELSGN